MTQVENRNETLMRGELIDLSNEFSNIAVEVTAETILEGFKKLDNGIIEVSLPRGITLLNACQVLNAEAKTIGIECPVFSGLSSYVAHPTDITKPMSFWMLNDENDAFKNNPGKVYRFRISKESINKSGDQQQRDHGRGVPLEAIALAETCERLTTRNLGSLLRFDNGDLMIVRSDNPEFALISYPKNGIYAMSEIEQGPYENVVWAGEVDAIV